jgi:PAS domain S-box-containing protein
MHNHNVHVLLIEDNSTDAVLIQEKLLEAQRVGWGLPTFKVERVNRLQAALDYLDRDNFDVILSDLDLPDSQADETVATLRRHFPHMPLVVLTGRADETLARKSVRSGVQDYLYKDEASGSLLARAMMYAVERQQARDRLEQRVAERTADLKHANDDLRAEIAERSYVEQALEEHTRILLEREARLRFQAQLLDSFRESLVATDLDGRIIYWGKGAEKLYGYRTDEVMGELITFIVASGDKAAEMARMRYALEHGVWRGQYKQRRKDGSEFWADTFISVATDEEGEPFGLIGLDLDITERHRIEEDLRLKDAAMATSMTAIAIFGLHGRLTYANDAFLTLWGYESLDDVSQQDPKAFWRHPEQIRDIIEALKKDQHWRGNLVAQRQDGSFFHLDAAVSMVKDPDHDAPLAMMASFLDISEQRRLEQRYRTLFNYAGDAIFVLDVQGRFVDVNQIACKCLGYSRDELLRMTPADVAMPEDAAGTMGRIERLQEVGSIVFEATLVRRDGLKLPFEISSRLIDFDGHPAILCIARDVIERKAAEEIVARYAGQLERSNQELEQFAYVISHDLREPLRMVSSYLELLRRRYAGALDDKADLYIDYAVEGADRMREMIDGLLNLSRVDTQGRAFAPTDVEELVARTLTSLGSIIRETGAEVTHDPLPTVMADATQLGQVFQNLIANALKFRREGLSPKIHIAARRMEDEWLFSVVDNGIGIDPTMADTIFKIFQRLHTEAEYPGLGIGLALCRRVIERHNGCIWVESTPGEGATFYFTLPLDGMSSS